ncbi:MAG: DUF5677 domain-containing protein [Acidobacteriia bacterium]|nr:DUF5677 domain-containing protein [Terriglobia bacterium]
MFKSEAERLDWLIGQVEVHASNATLPCPDPQNVEVFHVTASWLERCVALAKGVSVLVGENLYGAAGVVRRCLWELWIDWRYLLRVGDRRQNAAKVLFNTQVEVLEFMEVHHDKFDSEYLAKLRRNLLDFESRNANASAEVRRQRQRGRYHWSGLSHSAMERALGPGPGIYGPLSWDVHSAVSTIRDVLIDLSDDSVFFQFGQTEANTRPDFVLFSSGGVLFYIYNEFAEMWGLHRIALPE